MPSHNPSGSAADGEAPGWCGASRTRSTPGRMVKRSGGSSVSASPSTPAGTGAPEPTSKLGADHWRQSPRQLLRRPRAPGASITAMPSRPSSIRGREPEPIARPRRYTLFETRITAAESCSGSLGAGPVQRRRPRSVGADDVGRGVEDGAQLRLPVALALHRLGVEPERDVVDEGAPVDLGQVHPALASGDERVQRADDVVAVDAEVEREVVARAGRDAGERQVVLGGDRRDQGLGPVAARRRERVRAIGHRRADELLEVIARGELDGLDPPRARLGGEIGLERLPASGAGVPDHHRALRPRRRRQLGPDDEEAPRERQGRHQEADGEQRVQDQPAGEREHDRGHQQPRAGREEREPRGAAAPDRRPRGQERPEEERRDDQAARERLHGAEHQDDRAGGEQDEDGDRRETPHTEN